MSLASRLLSPAGFLLFLLCFLLPFVAVSCDAGPEGELSISYTGLDLLTNDEPTVVITGSFADLRSGVEAGTSSDNPPPLGVAPFAAATVGIGVLGLASVALPTFRRRLYGGLLLAVLGLAALVTTQWVSRTRLVRELKVGSSGDGTSGDFTGALTPESLLNNRAGFSLALLCLVLVGLGSGGLLVTERVLARRAAQPPAAPQYLCPPAGPQGFGPPPQDPAAQYPTGQYPTGQHPAAQHPTPQYPPPYEGQPDRAEPDPPTVTYESPWSRPGDPGHPGS